MCIRALPVLAMALTTLACEQGSTSQTKSSARPKAASTATATASAATAAASASAAATASVKMPKPEDKPLSERFAGEVPGVEFEGRAKGKFDGKWFVSIPKGWDSNTEQYHGMVILTAPKDEARMFVHDQAGSAEKNMEFWVRGGFKHKAEVEFDKPGTDGKLGPNGIEVMIHNGKGKLFGKPAQFWAFRIDQKKRGILVEGGIVEGASDQRKSELFAAMQSVGPK